MVSTDEATTNYADIIRNFEQAHDFIKSEFGVTPQVGWQLDPFGHSAVNASLMAQMGMEAVFMGRINFDDFDRREHAWSQELQFAWTPEFCFNQSTTTDEIFGNVNYTRYIPGYDLLDARYYTIGMHLTESEAEDMVPKWIELF